MPLTAEATRTVRLFAVRHVSTTPDGQPPVSTHILALSEAAARDALATLMPERRIFWAREEVDYDQPEAQAHFDAIWAGQAEGFGQGVLELELSRAREDLIAVASGRAQGDLTQARSAMFTAESHTASQGRTHAVNRLLVRSAMLDRAGSL